MNSPQSSPDKGRSYSIEEATQEMLPGIIELLEGFEYPFGQDHYVWRYHEAASGSLIIVARSSGETVGHYGYIKRPFYIDNDRTMMALAADLYVRKDFRGRAAYFRMSTAARKKFVKEEVEYTYGFPNALSGPVTKRAKAESTEFLPLYLKVFNLEAVVRNIKRFRIPGVLSSAAGLLFKGSGLRMPQGISVEAVKTCPDGLDELFQRVMEDPARRFVNIGDRTAGFIDWRFFSCPDRDYVFLAATDRSGVLRGYAILRILNVMGMREGVIVDIFHAPYDLDTCTALVKSALDHFSRARVDLLASMISDTATCIPDVLIKAGFRRFRKLLNPRPWVLAIRRTDLAQIMPVVLDSKKWFLTWGDCDVF